MGSKGSRSRKPEDSQHLPKVGSPAENEHSLHEAREAVLGQMGVRGASLGVKSIFTAIIVLLVVGAILGFLLLVVFR